MGNQGQDAPPTIPPSPVPTSFATGTATVPRAGRVVVVSVMTPVGTQTYFLEAQAAENLAEGLTKAAMLAKTGLVLPETNGKHS